MDCGSDHGSSKFTWGQERGGAGKSSNFRRVASHMCQLQKDSRWFKCLASIRILYCDSFRSLFYSWSLSCMFGAKLERNSCHEEIFEDPALQYILRPSILFLKGSLHQIGNFDFPVFGGQFCTVMDFSVAFLDLWWIPFLLAGCCLPGSPSNYSLRIFIRWTNISLLILELINGSHRNGKSGRTW